MKTNGRKTPSHETIFPWIAAQFAQRGLKNVKIDYDRIRVRNRHLEIPVHLSGSDIARHAEASVDIEEIWNEMRRSTADLRLWLMPRSRIRRSSNDLSATQVTQK